MKCPECQFQNPEEMQFCGKCGSKFANRCPKCGFENPDSFSFCGKCGESLLRFQGDSAINYKEPQSYTPKHLADKILTTRSSIEGERKFVTVLFADVANFTSMSERLDPEEVHQIMDGCFKILMDEIHNYEGTINQFTGDGVMALFGAPVAHEDHAQRACRSALEIQKTLEKYSRELELRFDIQFQMRIGINSGIVVVGSIGDDLRMDYTAVGDTTNLASRMETSAQPGTILLSEKTQKIVKDFFELNPIGEINVKGKEKPQKAFQVVRIGDVETRIGASVAKGLTRFVGRKNSMTTLTDAFKKIKSKSGQVVGIVGEAGVGKSRLLLEMRNLLPQDDFEYLEGRCLQYGGSILYLPILDILRSIFNIEDDDKEFLIKQKVKEVILNLDEGFVSLNPSLQDILSLKVDDDEYIKLQPKEKRDKIFEAIRNLFIRMSQDKPLVIAVEDLHWIDKTSEEFLSYFIDWLPNTSILLILLYRPEYTHQWGSKSFYTKIGVDHLGMISSGELVSAVLEEGRVAPELKQLILGKSSGNPLFIEEFSQTLLENGSIGKRENQYTLIGNPENLKVPDTIQGIIAARLDRLEDNLKRTMQIASVIGRDFAFKILQTITGMRADLKSHLLSLQGLEFIYEKNLFPELEYIFKHALTQEVAYNSLLQKRRKEIHEKIGTAIEEIYPEKVEEFYEMLAYHYCRSDNVNKAIQYSKLAGKKAFKSYSNLEAFRYYKDTFSMLKKQIKTEENKKQLIKVLLLLSTPMHQLGFPDDSIKFIHYGEKLSQEIADENSLSKFYSLIGVYYSYSGKQSIGIKYTEKSFKIAQKVENVKLMTLSAQALCTSYFLSGEVQKVVDVALNTINLIEKTTQGSKIHSGGFNSYCIICGYCGLSFAHLGNFVEAEAFCEKGHQLATDINHLPSLGWVENMCGYLYVNKGDTKNAIVYFMDSVKHLEDGKVTFMLGLTWGGLGWANILMGDLDHALKHTKKGLDIHLETGNPWYLASFYLILGMIYFKLGDLNNAEAYILKALEISKQTNEKQIEGPSQIWLGRILNKLGPPQIIKAKDCIFKGIQICKELKYKPDCAIGYLFLGELFADVGQQENSLKNLMKAEGMFQDMGIDFWLKKTQKLLAEL